MQQLKTVKELIDYLKQFPENTKIVKHGWDCYNDEPTEYDIMPCEVRTKKSDKIKKICL